MYQGFEWLNYGDPYWTRTSDLHPVKADNYSNHVKLHKNKYCYINGYSTSLQLHQVA